MTAESLAAFINFNLPCLPTNTSLVRIRQKELLVALLFGDNEQTEIQNVVSFYRGAKHRLF